MTPRLTIILGCTACGKGSIARALAARIDGEILSLDSMKIYRGMDIGTAKPTPETRAQVPHHLIDIADPGEDFSVARFLDHADRVINDLHAREKPILAVGGTALYIKALTEGLFDGPPADPALRAQLHRQADAEGTFALHQRLQEVDPTTAERVHVNDRRRIVRALEVYELTGQPISSFQTQWTDPQPTYDIEMIGLRRERDEQSRRINRRVHKMIDAGLVQEVEALLARDKPLSTTARQALGYAEIIAHLNGELALEDAVERIKIHTRRFAKAQRTWFKRFVHTRWFDLTEGSDPDVVAEDLIKLEQMPWSKKPR